MTNPAILLEQLRKTVYAKSNFPIGVLVYYGPDDQTVSKVVAVAIPARDADPILRRWQSIGVASNPETALEIGRFFKEQKVQEVVMTEGIVGCPHEEGVDYPAGESCPHCPFWARQTSR